MSARRRPRTDKPFRQPAFGHCPVTGKRRWPRRADARQHLRNLRAAGDTQASALVTYHCEHCPDWHVGHRGSRKDAA